MECVLRANFEALNQYFTATTMTTSEKEAQWRTIVDKIAKENLPIPLDKVQTQYVFASLLNIIRLENKTVIQNNDPEVQLLIKEKVDTLKQIFNLSYYIYCIPSKEKCDWEFKSVGYEQVISSYSENNSCQKFSSITQENFTAKIKSLMPEVADLVISAQCRTDGADSLAVTCAATKPMLIGPNWTTELTSAKKFAFGDSPASLVDRAKHYGDSKNFMCKN